MVSLARCCAAGAGTARRRSRARYPLVELGTGVLFGVVTAWWLGPVVGAARVPVPRGDLRRARADRHRHHRLPDAIVLPSYLVALVLLALALEPGGEPRLGRAAARACIGGAVLFAVLLRRWSSSTRAGMGFGDVKLAGVLGLYLGWFGLGRAGRRLVRGLPARRPVLVGAAAHAARGPQVRDPVRPVDARRRRGRPRRWASRSGRRTRYLTRSDLESHRAGRRTAQVAGRRAR